MKLLPQRSPNFLPLCVVAGLILGGLNLLMSLGVIGTVISLLNKPAPRLVETADGLTRHVVALDHAEPTPESIRQFVASTLYSLYDWRGILPPDAPEDLGSPQPDLGVLISTGNGELKITTATWRAGFRLSDGIRKDILTQIALLTPQDIFTTQPRTQTAMTSPVIGVPQKVEEDLWKVDYTGLLMVFANGDNLGDQVVREHEVYVRVIDPLVPVDQAIDNPQISNLQRVVMEERRAGLVIESMPERLRN
ncbi:hypothetical protein [Picosynechococcus sp. PCC 7117]|uniref:hypothetical protein n=1 Tax=Picosynechococcus sp. PCC 7117 TaxID=195498 RepID=UPI0008104FEF|nr:hypothetical protein [Picosynechococcus sp. PCC 7117]ANV89085.1 hypothetical protein AWQ22_15965 [Picosynechococcus sp. PCC 7117]